MTTSQNEHGNEIEGGFLTTFMDKIWLQMGIATGITVLWIIWIVYEILFKGSPA